MAPVKSLEPAQPAGLNHRVGQMFTRRARAGFEHGRLSQMLTSLDAWPSYADELSVALEALLARTHPSFAYSVHTVDNVWTTLRSRPEVVEKRDWRGW